MQFYWWDGLAGNGPNYFYIISDSVQRWFHIFVPKRLEVDLMRTTATGSDEKPFINSVDVTKLLQHKRYALGLLPCYFLSTLTHYKMNIEVDNANICNG